MRECGARPIILLMTTFSRSSKVLLVADVRSDPPGPGAAGAVRRYRLARLRFVPQSPGPTARSEHLRRVRA